MPRAQCQLWSISPREQYRQEAGYPHGAEFAGTDAVLSVLRLTSTHLRGSRGAEASHGGGCAR
eukprot:9862-Lingulodinium_polyedra.AAC.1